MTLKDRPDLDPGEQNRNRIAAKAEENGWTVVGRNPMILEGYNRRVVISFNGAGNPSKVEWEGEEFDPMPSTGYVDLSILFSKWLTWRPESE
jgi:hypothetical protein